MATAGSDEEAAEQSKEAELKSVRPSRSAENFSNGAFPNGETSRQQAGTWRTYSNSAYDSQLPPGEGFRGVAENEDRYYRQELPSEETPAAEANGFVREEGPDYSGEDAEMAGQGVRGASYREASSVAFSMNEEGGNGRSTPVGLYPGLVPGLPAQVSRRMTCNQAQSTELDCTELE